MILGLSSVFRIPRGFAMLPGRFLRLGKTNNNADEGLLDFWRLVTEDSSFGVYITYYKRKNTKVDHTYITIRMSFTVDSLAPAAVPAFKCPPGTKMHLLDLGRLQADDGW
jgi:hypothetical protein